ncbi:MAG: sensor histidine kinase [Cellulosilyticaceae bacterium]
MYLILLFREVIANEKKMLVAYSINTIILIIIFNLMIEKASILYPVSVSLYILIFYLISKIYEQHRKKSILEVLKINNEITYEQQKRIDPIVFKIIQEMHYYYKEELDQIRNKAKEKDILFSKFAHNMKTSVAVIKLAVEVQNEKAIEDIQMENMNQGKYLEEMLNVLRFEEFSNDYIPQCVDVVELTEKLISSKRRDFIYSGIYPKIYGTSCEVYTDPKWCSYIIWQVLSNAIKYSYKNSYITLTIRQEEGRVILEIKDEGIGIPEDELERVFEMFYTGRNGRTTTQGTGIGLAMVKKISSKLGHEVLIQSEVGKGTTFTIRFLTSV